METLVSIVLFVSLVTVTVLIHKMGGRAFQKTQAQGDVYRMAMLAAEHLKSDMQGARVEGVTPRRLVLRIPQMENGQRKVNMAGETVWNPSLKEITLQNDGGNNYMVSTFEGTSRRLASLGEGGTVTFSKPSVHLLKVVVCASVGGQYRDKSKEGSYTVNLSFFLPSQ